MTLDPVTLCFSPVTVDELKSCITTADPQLESSEVDRIVAWAYRVESPEKFPECEAIEQSAILDRLQTAYIRPSKK